MSPVGQSYSTLELQRMGHIHASLSVTRGFGFWLETIVVCCCPRAATSPWKPSLRAYFTAFAADDAPIRASATKQHK
jgi:hypothetical protein